MEFLFYLSLLTLFMVLISNIIWLLGQRSIKFLKDISPANQSTWPEVSIIIPARNEERNLEEALRSVLSLDYPRYQVLVVNDRSTDGTRDLLDRLDPSDAKLRVFHIENLPAGWLGKNHALHHGAQHAKGELLLFADADVVMEPSVLKRSISYMQEHRLDHIVIGPDVRVHGALLKMMILSFLTSFMLFFMPWRAKYPKSKRFTGGGAFSLFGKQVYETVGTMKALATTVDDDLRLGERIKKSGFRQEFVAGADLLFVEWYSSVREMIEGLTKNMFAVLGFSLAKTALLAIVTFLYYLWPPCAILLTAGWTQLLNGAITIALLILFASSAKYVQMPLWHAIGFPVAMAIHLFIMLRSAWFTVSKGGITWRGTFYSMGELKKVHNH